MGEDGSAMLRFGCVLKRTFYERPTAEVARALLVKVLVHGPAAGIIVETEAYLAATICFPFRARASPLAPRYFGEPGHAYVYLIYGMYQCLNLVAEPAGSRGAF